MWHMYYMSCRVVTTHSLADELLLVLCAMGLSLAASAQYICHQRSSTHFRFGSVAALVDLRDRQIAVALYDRPLLASWGIKD